VLLDGLEILGDREAAICRELTKRFEEVTRGPISALAAGLDEAEPPRGEVVLVIGPPLPVTADPVEVDAALREALRRSSVRDAAREVAEATGLGRKELYARALALRDDWEDEA
ncbi:MAG: 16S rRNA (cytidine(1402)-2'-O)-methyltransferase, partial [Pseudomonadota bacterium]